MTRVISEAINFLRACVEKKVDPIDLIDLALDHTGTISGFWKVLSGHGVLRDNLYIGTIALFLVMQCKKETCDVYDILEQASEMCVDDPIFTIKRTRAG